MTVQELLQLARRHTLAVQSSMPTRRANPTVPEAGVSLGHPSRPAQREHGLLRHEDLPSGSCKVRLLSVDGRGWDVA
jgi:hypothetical protein